MKWLLMALLSNGSNVQLAEYPTRQACEVRAETVRMEIKKPYSEMTACGSKYKITLSVLDRALYEEGYRRPPFDDRTHPWHQCMADVENKYPYRKHEKRESVTCIQVG